MKRLVAILFLALAASAAWSQADELWFWGKPIAAFQWEGTSHADKRELDTATKAYLGRDFTEELWLELQGKLYELDWFEKIEPAALPADDAQSKVIIKFVVVEKPSIDSIRVVGNSGLRTNELLDVITEKSGDIYKQSKAKIDELAVRRLYLEKGYPDATVSSSSAPGKADGTVVVNFSVSEGAQVAIKEIRFSGNQAVAAQTLKGQLGLKEKSLFQSGAFQESKLEEDKRSVVDYYRSRGYVDASISDVIRGYEKDPKSGKTWLILTIAVKEGLQWTYGGTSFEGNKIFPTEKLSALMTQKAGGPLNYKKLEQDKQRVDDLYLENGYIFNQITLAESRDPDKGSISYTIKILEYDRAHIESISFKGNTKTKDHVLYRELPLEVGDIFSKAKIVEGLRNLYNLQYFSAVEPGLFQGSAEGLMNLVFNVEEQSTADIQFGMTLSGFGEPDTFPLSGLVKLSDRNFRGNGQDVGIELNAATTSQTLTLSFQDKWLFGERFSGGIDLSFAHKTKTAGQDILGPIFDDGVPDPYTEPLEDGYSLSDIPTDYLMPYTYWDFAISLTAGHSTHTSIGDFGYGGGYTFDLGMKEYDADKYRPADASLREANGDWRLSNKFLLRGYLNNLDLWYNPGKGYYASQRLTWAGILDWEREQYLKTDTRFEAYTTLFNIPVFEGWSWKWVLGGHTGFSALLKKPGVERKITDDYLYLDGVFNARGWSNLDGKEGVALWDNWLELRMPIVESFLWIDGFFDAAALQTESGLLQMTASAISGDSSSPSFLDGFGWDNMAFSLGFGFRFAISQFPFRFYFAKCFSYDGSSIDWTPDGHASSGMDFVISITQSLY